jgi:hypothetical protein
VKKPRAMALSHSPGPRGRRSLAAASRPKSPSAVSRAGPSQGGSPRALGGVEAKGPLQKGFGQPLPQAAGRPAPPEKVQDPTSGRGLPGPLLVLKALAPGHQGAEEELVVEEDGEEHG